MAYTCSFVDEVLYGPEDVNEVVGDLVGAGVAPFISKSSYTPSDLNSLTASVVSSGAQLNGCKVSRISATVVSVAPGIIYFGNGMRLKVTVAHSITVPANTAVTIYAYYVSSEGTGKLGYTTVAISKSDYNIPLATISTTGTITDAREFAESKVVTMGTNEVYEIPAERVTLFSDDWDALDYDGGGKIMCIVDLNGVNLNKFNHFFYLENEHSSYGNEVQVRHKLWDFKNQKKQDIDLAVQSGVFTGGTHRYLTRNGDKFLFITEGADYTSCYNLYVSIACSKEYMKLL